MSLKQNERKDQVSRNSLPYGLHTVASKRQHDDYSRSHFTFCLALSEPLYVSDLLRSPPEPPGKHSSER